MYKLMALATLCFLNLGNAEKNRLENEQRGLQNEISSLDSQKKKLNKDIENKRKEITDLESQDYQAKKNLAEAISELVGIENDIKKSRDQKSTLQEELTTLEERQRQNQRTLLDLTATNENLQNHQIYLQGEEKELIEERQGLESNNTLMKDQLESSKIKLTEAQSKIEDQSIIQEEIETLHKKMVKASNKNTELDTVKAIVGFLTNGNGDQICSATLIDEGVIRTTAHCLLDSEIQGKLIRFTNLNAESSLIKAVLSRDASQDVLLLELKDSIKSAKYLETIKPEPDFPVTMIFRDLETGGILAQSCDIIRIIPEKSYFEHQCSTHRGVSGSALFQFGFLVGAHIGKSEDGKGLATFFTMAADQNLGQVIGSSSLEVSCNSNCLKTFNYPCPTWKKPGRTCQGKTTDLVCESAKKAACLRDEAQRALEAVISGLKKSVNSLTEQRNRLKISVDGLNTTLDDLKDTALGRSQSVKDTLGKINEVAKDIDQARATLTREVLFVDELKVGIQTTLNNLQISDADIHKLIDGIEEIETTNSKKASSNKQFKQANKDLEKANQSLNQEIERVQEDYTKAEERFKQIARHNAQQLKAMQDLTIDLPPDVQEVYITLKKEISIKNARRLGRKFNYLLIDTWEWVKDRFAYPSQSKCELDPDLTWPTHQPKSESDQVAFNKCEYVKVQKEVLKKQDIHTRKRLYLIDVLRKKIETLRTEMKRIEGGR